MHNSRETEGGSHLLSFEAQVMASPLSGQQWNAIAAVFGSEGLRCRDCSGVLLGSLLGAHHHGNV